MLFIIIQYNIKMQYQYYNVKIIYYYSRGLLGERLVLQLVLPGRRHLLRQLRPRGVRGGSPGVLLNNI